MDQDEAEELSGPLRRVTMTTTTGVPIARTTWTGGTDPYIGSLIDGKYEVSSRLGEGGMGVVYRCRHTILDRTVAMKVLRLDMAKNLELTERFLNEARSASSIGNPHIIDILDFGQLPDGATYFLMEFLEGNSLTSLLEAGRRLPLERLLDIAIQLTEALGAAHRAGIVHRDLKPDNVFLIQRGDEDDFVKVLDFGIAKANTATNQLTQAGQVFGTPHYMAPEQAAGKEVDGRADIYSLGVMLFELVSGRLPFDGDNFMSILTQHMYKEAPRMRDLGESGLRVAPELEAVIQRCLLKTPADRYASMEELGADLRTLLVGGTPTVYASPFRTSVDSFLSNLGLSRSTSHFPGDGVPLRPSIGLFLLGIACVCLGAWLVFSLTHKPRPESPAQAARAPTMAPTQPAPEPTMAKTSRHVALAVSPLDAHVFLGEEDLGTSPVVLEVAERPLILRVERKGYASKTLTIDGNEARVMIELVREKSPAKARAGEGPKSAPHQHKATDPSGIINPWGK